MLLLLVKEQFMNHFNSTMSIIIQLMEHYILFSIIKLDIQPIYKILDLQDIVVMEQKDLEYLLFMLIVKMLKQFIKFLNSLQNIEINLKKYSYHIYIYISYRTFYLISLLTEDMVIMKLMNLNLHNLKCIKSSEDKKKDFL